MAPHAGTWRTTDESAGARRPPEGRTARHSTRSARRLARLHERCAAWRPVTRFVRGGTSDRVRATMPPMRPIRDRHRSAVALAAPSAWLAVASPVLAHGPVPPEPPTVGSLLLGWTFEPLPTLAHRVPPSSGGCGPCGGSMRAHPANPVPRRRSVAFLAGDARAGVRAAVRHRALRHDALLGPHGPARPADARRRAAASPCPRRSRWSCGSLPRRPAGAGSCRSSIRGVVAGRSRFPVVAWVIFAGGHVGEPLLAAVRRGARGPARPRPRARAVPGGGAAVLVAGRRRSIPAPWRMPPPGPGRVRLPADAPEHVPRGRHPERDGVLYPALRDARPAVGPDAAGGPAAGRRDHVDRRRRDLPDRDHGRRRRAGCGPRRASRPRADRRADASWPTSAIREASAGRAARRASGRATARVPASASGDRASR